MSRQIKIKESGRIRYKFGRNAGIKKRMKNYRLLVCIFECYSFNSILDYKKMSKF